MYAHRYTITFCDYAEPEDTWFVHTNGPDVRPIGAIYTRNASNPDAFTAMTADRHYAGTCPNLIAAADLLYQVDRAMARPEPDEEHEHLETTWFRARLEREETKS